MKFGIGLAGACILLVAALVLFGPVRAVHQTPSQAGGAAPTRVQAHAALQRHLPGLRLEQVGQSAATGLLEIRTSEGIAYATADGRHFIRGELIATATHENLTAQDQRQARRAALARLDRRSTIEFSPANPRHTIVVFTDVDCSYCRKLHAEVEELGRLGIAVRYAAFPRSGPTGATWKKMQTVWCAANRQEALTRSTQNQRVERSANCSAPAIAEHYSLGLKLGLKGTPFIVLEDGSTINGYRSAQQLAARLERRPPA